ncbi:hypothetical protein L484_011876 [Morus notabilis]|uniref:Uncharacterized protein n=1 Tax=Morus notabilis TaxID=981085 RepID=W9SCK0_9ROSA|nr:hypothetical protein L484_011876 [Morus notabilis]
MAASLLTTTPPPLPSKLVLSKTHLRILSVLCVALGEFWGFLEKVSEFGKMKEGERKRRGGREEEREKKGKKIV